MPKRPGGATTSSTGMPSTVTPTARLEPRSTIATTVGEASSRSSASGSARDERELVDDVAPAAHLAGDLAVELARDRLARARARG